MGTTHGDDSTRLNLLTRDGGIEVEFAPGLEEPHYAELLDIVKDFDSDAVARHLILDAAKRWAREVTF